MAPSAATTTTVDDYIAAQPEGSRPLLERVRATLRAALPRAVEGISYQIPAYELQGAPVLYFAGWKRHYSLYPVTEVVLEALSEELTAHQVQKGTVRFPLSEAAPVGLIRRIAKLRAGEVAGRAGKKKTKKKTAPRKKKGTTARSSKPGRKKPVARKKG